MSQESHIGYVTSISSDSITIEIADDVKAGEDGKTFTRQQVYERAKDAGQLEVGNYLKIRHGNDRFVLANINGLSSTMNEREAERKQDWEFTIRCQPVGSLESDGTFRRGVSRLPVPRQAVYPVDAETISKIYLNNDQFNFNLGKLSANEKIPVFLDGDRLFSKHVAVVGSTGSGKSCTVAKILHEAVGVTSDATNLHAARQKNSHIVIFDLHAEYESAFSLDDDQNFNLNLLSVGNLILPYWLMNSEELESVFIESHEQTSHNQVSAFKKGVIENKKHHNPEIADHITYDSPVYFSLREVINYVTNLNREVISKEEGKVDLPALRDESSLNRDELHSREELYFAKVHEFAATERTKKVTGPFNGKFPRFVSRLENRFEDKRLKFLMSPVKADKSPYRTEDYGRIVRQYIGYVNRSNVTIVDLSGIPFEVLSICISLISRVIFDFCFEYTKECHKRNTESDVPVMIVCEEAHNYVPQNDSVMYRPSRESIERIAKEGRKYGISLMVVSQRPSEVSETVFAQCNNFVALRLTNINDQRYVTSLLPDNLNSVTSMLPNLGEGECIAIGDAVPLPSIVQMDLPNPQPKSQSVRFHKEWLEDWVEDKFDAVIERLKER